MLPTPHSWLPAPVAAGMAVSLLLLAALPGRAGAGQQIRLDAPAAPQRWLVRLQFQQLPVLRSRVDGRPKALHLWSTGGGLELLVRHERRLYMIDAREGRLFQIPDSINRQLAKQFEVLLAYPVPIRPLPEDSLTEAIQLQEPAVELGPALLPAANELSSIKSSDRGSNPYLPNIAMREYRQVFRISFRAGARQLELFLERPPG